MRILKKKENKDLINVTVAIPVRSIRFLLDGLLGRSWSWFEEMKSPKEFSLQDFEPNGKSYPKEEQGESIPFDPLVLMTTVENFYTIWKISHPTKDEKAIYRKVGLKQIKSALEKLAKICPWHFEGILKEDWDINVYDCFGQLCVYDDIFFDG